MKRMIHLMIGLTLGLATAWADGPRIGLVLGGLLYPFNFNKFIIFNNYIFNGK